MTRVIFFGTSSFAKNQLLFLLDHNIDIVAVVTQPDRPRGRKQKYRPCPVKEGYIERNLTFPLFQPEKASDKDFIQKIEDLKPDLLIVVAYGQILKQQLLDIPAMDCINVHASLLPKYRGAAPIQRAIMAGEKETGVTIMKMVKKLDAGEMLYVKKVPISKQAIFADIEEALSQVSGPALLKVIKDFEKGIVQRAAQDESQVTYAEKIVAEDLYLDFNKEAESLHNQIRSLSPKPGAFFLTQENKRVKVLLSEVIDLQAKPYEIVEYTKNRWVVGSKKQALSILRLQIEGKKAVDFKEFFKGHPKPPLFSKTP